MNGLSLFDNFFGDGFDVLPEFDAGCSLDMPRVDVKENKDAYTMVMDLPGMTEQDVNIELDHNVLTVSSSHEENKEEGDKKDQEKEEGRWLIRERSGNGFSRQFTLPDDVNDEKVAASFKNGVLTINMPRKVLAEPKKIAIEAA